MSFALYWDEPRRREIEAPLTDVREIDGAYWAAFERTIFYPRGGGQPGDHGIARFDNGEIAIGDAARDGGKIWHRMAGAPPPAGSESALVLDWPRRWRMMQTHTAMHLLCAAVGAPVTGGNMDALRGRIDFDSDGPLDKEEIAARMNEWIAADIPVSWRMVEESELDANPGLVRTMSVSPPRGAGSIRLVEIAGVDLQACGGTHVARTGEIGSARVVKIEKKGRQNRRVVFELDAKDDDES